MISYLPGEAGHIIGRIVNNSLSTGPSALQIGDNGDADWKNILDRIRILEPKPSKHKTRALSDSIYSLPPRASSPTAMTPETMMKGRAVLKTLDIGDERHCLITHARPTAIRELFPYCRIVSVYDDDEYFSIRAHYEKKVRGHKKKPETIKKETRNRRRSTTRRRLMKQIEDSRLITIPRRLLLSENWKSEYDLLCSFLELEPEYERTGHLIEQWVKKQWTRPIL